MTIKHNLLCALVGFLLLCACKPTVPSEFISESDMEELLYDYHMADGYARQAKGDYATNLLEYHAAVLKKHGVTQAQFDTSMVYYMRHTSRLHTIYEHLSQRLGSEAQALGASGAGMTRISASGDTIDVWKGPQSLTLIPNQPYNYYQYSVKADSSFHKGDNVLLVFNTNFIFQEGTRNGMAYMAVVFQNDSVVGRQMHLSSSNHYSLYINDSDSLGIKEIKGYFMLGMNNQANASSTTLRLMSVEGIHLLRCRNSQKSPVNSQNGPGSSQNGPGIKLPDEEPSPDMPREATDAPEQPQREPAPNSPATRQLPMRIPNPDSVKARNLR